MSTNYLWVSIHSQKHCAYVLLIRCVSVAFTTTIYPTVPTKNMSGSLVSLGGFPFDSKWKHPSLAAPLASTSHSIDADEGSSLITFPLTELMVFASVVAVLVRQS